MQTESQSPVEADSDSKAGKRKKGGGELEIWVIMMEHQQASGQSGSTDRWSAGSVVGKWG